MVIYPSCINLPPYMPFQSHPLVPVRGVMAPLVAGSKGKEEQKEG